VPRRTIARPVELDGVGLHTGADVRLRLEPAAAGRGIVFERRDLAGSPPVGATLAAVGLADRRTAVRSGACRVDTIEHLLASVHAAGLADLVIALDGPEVPILDGSFAPFTALLDDAGRVELPGECIALRLDQPAVVCEGESRYSLEPADGLFIDVTLEYAEPVIGRQHASCALSEASFRTEIAPARTFGFLAEVAPLKARGQLAGGSSDCAVLLSPTAVLNTALRWPDEFVRHKIGDLIGDLALLGARLNVRVRAVRPSHRGNLACARFLARATRILEA
jgi:UDP-3-O-acyl N-acetylglucosamine deacetylase